MGDLFKFNNEAKFRMKANETQTEAEITIYAAIGDYWFEDSVSAKSFSDQLKNLPSTITQLNVRVNSPGGDVFDGVTIYNRLKQHKANITVYVDGMAASIASIIALAGDEVIMGEGAQFMVHKPMTGGWGNSIELMDIIDRLDDIEEQMLSIYQRRTGMDRSELKSMLAKETWLDADEAIEFGFATRKAEGTEQMRVAACDLSKTPWIKKASAIKMKTKSDLVKEDVTGILSDLGNFLDEQAK